MSTAELATSYAALILADDGVEITVWPTPNSKMRRPALRAALAGHDEKEPQAR